MNFRDGAAVKNPSTPCQPVTAMTVNNPLFDPLRFVEPTAPAKPREALIAEAAYFRAQSRAFEPGHEEEDWLAAEAEVDRASAGLVGERR